jgi:hypothetical protein
VHGESLIRRRSASGKVRGNYTAIDQPWRSQAMVSQSTPPGCSRQATDERDGGCNECSRRWLLDAPRQGPRKRSLQDALQCSKKGPSNCGAGVNFAPAATLMVSFRWVVWPACCCRLSVDHFRNAQPTSSGTSVPARNPYLPFKFLSKNASTAAITSGTLLTWPKLCPAPSTLKNVAGTFAATNAS